MTRLRALWDRLTLYLPVLLMGVLAMATYWLVRSTPTASTPEAAAAPQHQPDYEAMVRGMLDMARRTEASYEQMLGQRLETEARMKR
mgnify:CR=1 FL=1